MGGGGKKRKKERIENLQGHNSKKFFFQDFDIIFDAPFSPRYVVLNS